MTFLTLAKKRYSARSYEQRPVEQEKVAAIVEAGRVAPTAANRQPVRVVPVETEEGRAKLAHGADVYGAPLAFVVCVQRGRAWRRSIDGKTTDDIDAAIVCDHMMMAATDEGLGSVWICWFDPAVVKRELDLPEDVEPVSILAVGYAAGEPASPERHATQRIAPDTFVLPAR